MNSWDVFRVEKEDSGDGSWVYTRLIDTVFYDEDCNAQYVWSGLVNHDGYPSDIVVRNSKLHKELGYYRCSLDDYAYDTKQDLEKLEAMYIYPANASL